MCRKNFLDLESVRLGSLSSLAGQIQFSCVCVCVRVLKILPYIVHKNVHQTLHTFLTTHICIIGFPMLVKSKTNTHITDTKPHLHIKLSDREHPSLLIILHTFFSKLIKHCIFCTNKNKNQISISDKLVYHFPLKTGNVFSKALSLHPLMAQQDSFHPSSAWGKYPHSVTSSTSDRS